MQSTQNIGGYTLYERLGQGGMGQVWRAKDSSGNDVAFKLIHPVACQDKQTYQRILREVSILSKLDTDSIASLIDYELDENPPFVVTEFIDGLTLSQYIKEYGTMSYEQAGKLAIKLYQTLHYLHSRSVIHRDIKPANIIISATDATPVLIDFGIAQQEYDDRITHTGMVSGTPGYLAPEVFAGKALNTACDFWALAAVIGYVLTGKNPFGSDSWASVMLRVQRGELVYTDEDLPAEYRQVLAMCLNPDLDKRADFSVLIDALQDISSVPALLEEDSDTVVYRVDDTSVMASDESVPNTCSQEPKYTSEVPEFIQRSFSQQTQDTSYLPEEPAYTAEGVAEQHDTDLLHEAVPRMYVPTRNFDSGEYPTRQYVSPSFSPTATDDTQQGGSEDTSPEGVQSKTSIKLLTFVFMVLFTADLAGLFTADVPSFEYFGFVSSSVVLLFMAFIGSVQVDESKTKVANFFSGLLLSPWYLVKALVVTAVFWLIAFVSLTLVLVFMGVENVYGIATEIATSASVDSLYATHDSLRVYLFVLVGFSVAMIFYSSKYIWRGAKVILSAMELTFFKAVFLYIIMLVLLGIFVLF